MKKYTVAVSVEAGGREQKAERLPALGTCPHSGHIPPSRGWREEGGGRREDTVFAYRSSFSGVEVGEAGAGAGGEPHT